MGSGAGQAAKFQTTSFSISAVNTCSVPSSSIVLPAWYNKVIFSRAMCERPSVSAAANSRGFSIRLVRQILQYYFKRVPQTTDFILLNPLHQCNHSLESVQVRIQAFSKGGAGLQLRRPKVAHVAK